MNNKLLVVYAADNNYAKYLGISMLSLFQKNEIFDEIMVFILDYGIEDSNKEKLQNLAKKFNRRVIFKSIESAISTLDLNMGARKISVVSYSRLLLSSILSDHYDRILYLDCDTLVMDCLNDLWNVDLGDNPVLGVQDTVDSHFLKKIGMESDECYVNAGVLLIDLDNWRKENLENKFIDCIKKFDGNVPHHDQGVINAVCRHRKGIVEPRYNLTSNMYSFSASTIKKLYFMDNYYSQRELDEAKRNPAIIHFTQGLVGRPWEQNCTHPEREKYMKVWGESPWKGEPILPDSRKPSIKIFAFIYKYAPLFLSEGIYRMLSRFVHINE
ncbi:MAG TPA: glycosyltransferase family 8 protein [Clostridia bacterium]|nr:glycosyltransferase family 8 protein [Clostridia bacterium]